ncbi:MAG: hypothetical protein ACYDDA_11980 [Acidiferrobacteraceae bacterium]
MSLSCACHDYDGDGWFFYGPKDYTVAPPSRRKRCCSCHALIDVGAVCTKFQRQRAPLSWVEERIHGDEVNLSPYFMCERCSDLYFSLTELGFCITLGASSMEDLAKEYREHYGARRLPVTSN